MEHIYFDTVELQLDTPKANFEAAKARADDSSKTLLREPMLIAWYDGIEKEEHPQIPECQHKPGWIAYAEGHNGKLFIDVNQGQFMFIYADIEDID